MPVKLETLYNLPSDTLNKRGKAFLAAHQPDKALTCFSIVANRWNKPDITRSELVQSVDAMCSASSLYQNSYGDIPNAYSMMLKAREIAEKQNLHEVLPNVYLTEALVRTTDELIISDECDTLGVRLFKKAFYASLKEKNWDMMMISSLNMLLKTSMYGKEQMLDKEMNIIMRSNIPQDVVLLKYVRQLIRGLRAIENNDKEQSIEELSKLYDLSFTLPDPKSTQLGRIMAKKLLYRAYLKFGDNDKALQELLDCEQIAKSHGETLHLLDIYNYLSEFYTQTGNSTVSRRYRLLFLEGKNKVLEESHLTEARNREFLFMLNEKNAEIIEAENKRIAYRRTAIIVISFSLVLIFVLSLLLIKYRQVARQNKKLYQNIVDQLEREKNTNVSTDKETPEEQEETTTRKPLTEAQSLLLHNIIRVLESSDEIYTTSFTLERLSDLVESKRYLVSQVINDSFGESFNTILGEYRIKEACRRMRDFNTYGNYTIEAISNSVGFKSRTNFIATFKKVTGMTPSTFQRMAKTDTSILSEKLV